jgi:ferrochelatase
MSREVGVLVMAHGTPRRTEEVLPFYTRIRRGNPPTPELLADLQARYDAIGGLSPLNERTAAQVRGLQRTLDARTPDRYLIAFGAKHTEPFVEDAAALLQESGVTRVIGLVLTPHGSAAGSEEYMDRARAALKPGVMFRAVPPWYAQPRLVQLLAARVSEALGTVGSPVAVEGGGSASEGGGGGRKCPVIFTAHSVPERVRGTYPEQLEESARLVAEAAGVPPSKVIVAWQSAGRTQEAWLGPDVRDVVRELAAAGQEKAFVVCPIGFVADHLEVLYDLDTELAAVAADVGLRMARTASLNDDPGFLEALADAVLAADAEDG